MSGTVVTPKQKLHKRLFKARCAAEAVAKRGKNEGGDFYFARFEDVLAEADKQLEAQKILILPQVVGTELRFSPSGFAIAKVEMEFDVIDTVGGGAITQCWSGTGHDHPGDKALFKAQTGCEKYFLAKLLGIPFGTDPEAEASPSADDPSPEARRIIEAQDRAAEGPQVPPARHSRPLPSSDLPPAEWESTDDEREAASV